MSSPGTPLLNVQDLHVAYGAVKALHGISFKVRHGEIVTLIGANGAGKSTTLNTIIGLVKCQRGAVELNGSPITNMHAHEIVHQGMALAPEGRRLFLNLTVRENLDVQRRLVGVGRSAVGETMDLFGLAGCADRRAGQLSLGNKQRLSLARALLHRPDLLLLDEPANGLDPAGIVEVRHLLRRLADESGVTVFMSSHILAEVAHLAHRIGIVHEGRLVQEIAYDDLRARTRGYLEVGVSEADRAAAMLGERLGIEAIERTDEGMLRLFDGLDRAGEVARTLVGAGLDLTRLAAGGEDLETYFMRLTGGES